MATKDARSERTLITRRDPKRPYGAKVTFHIWHAASIGDIENATLLLDSGCIATIEPARKASWEGGKSYAIALQGFTTASAAEAEGLRMAQSLLLLAVSLNFGLGANARARA